MSKHFLALTILLLRSEQCAEYVKQENYKLK